MARITIEDALARIPNRFELTLAATNRARQISAGSQPLLDAEFEKERRQQERRDDQKETEICEIFAEVGRAARSLQALFLDRLNRQSHLDRVERGSQLFFKCVTRSL